MFLIIKTLIIKERKTWGKCVPFYPLEPPLSTNHLRRQYFSGSNKLYILFEGHWIDDDFKRKNYVLKCEHFPESHTALNISNKLVDVWEYWLIENSRRHVLLRDGATNVTSASDEAGILSCHCNIHKIQLIVAVRHYMFVTLFHACEKKIFYLHM